MDAEQWRAELRTFIAEEVRQYLSTYRGAGTAELSRVGAELTSEMTRIAANLAKKREELVAALAVPGQVDHVVRTWGRAIFTGAFMLAGILGAAWLALAWTEQQFRWQVAKNQGRPSPRVNAMGRGGWRHSGGVWTRPLSGPAWKRGELRIHPNRNTTRAGGSSAPWLRLRGKYRRRRSNADGRCEMAGRTPHVYR